MKERKKNNQHGLFGLQISTKFGRKEIRAFSSPPHCR